MQLCLVSGNTKNHPQFPHSMFIEYMLHCKYGIRAWLKTRSSWAIEATYVIHLGEEVSVRQDMLSHRMQDARRAERTPVAPSTARCYESTAESQEGRNEKQQESRAVKREWCMGRHVMPGRKEDEKNQARVECHLKLMRCHAGTAPRSGIWSDCLLEKSLS